MGKSTTAEAMALRQKVEQLSARGMKPAEIAAAVGVTRQHAWRVLNQMKDAKTVSPLAAMTADEFRQAMETLGYSETQMATALDMKLRAIEYFTAGERPVRPVVAAAVRMLLANAKRKRKR